MADQATGCLIKVIGGFYDVLVYMWIGILQGFFPNKELYGSCLVNILATGTLILIGYVLIRIIAY
jgi:hypothetical protein